MEAIPGRDPDEQITAFVAGHGSRMLGSITLIASNRQEVEDALAEAARSHMEATEIPADLLTRADRPCQVRSRRRGLARAGAVAAVVAGAVGLGARGDDGRPAGRGGQRRRSSIYVLSGTRPDTGATVEVFRDGAWTTPSLDGVEALAALD